MTPSSYANAAGLQSEINHVTITRVAFSEVEYRRSVNSYRRDMRFTINAISREQKRLRRSMRDYSRVLRKGRRERERRKQAQWEESKKDNSSSTDNIIIDTVEAAQTGESAPAADVTADSTTAAPDVMSEKTAEELTKSGSTLVTSECDQGENPAESSEEKAPSKITRKQKSVSVQKSGREKAFFKPKRNLSKTSSTAESDNKEETSEPKTDPDSKTDEPTLTEEPDDKDDGDDKTKDEEEEARKRVSLEALRLRLGSHSQADNNNENTPGRTKWQLVREKHEKDELLPEDSPARRKRGKKEVSLGDLIKLQHTRGSKKLFQLVDKMAKRHGVQDDAAKAGPPRLPDTRDTARLVSKQDQTLQSSAFRTAGAFYPIKYGYAVTEEMGKFVFLPSVEVVQEGEEDDVDSASQLGDSPKPVYGNLVSPAGDSDFWDKVQKDLNTRRSEVSLQEASGRSERRQTRVLSLPSLVKAVSKFKQGANGAAALRPKSEVLPDTQRETTAPPSSRGGELSRASGKTSSDRTPSIPRKLPPLQKMAAELEGAEERGKVGWKTALQSMKLVHTLENLKRHF